MLTGDNGILTKADTATKETKRQEIIENAKLEILEYEAENEGKITDEKALEIIEKYDKDYNKNETFEFKTNEKDEEYIITENGHNILVSEIWKLPRKIKFIMDDIEFEAIEGMTWRQWLLEKRKRRDK